MADEAASPELKQQRMKEFMSLLPLTIELAGLGKCDPARIFNEGQMEVRISVIRNAYKLARQLVRDVGETGS